jgi:hypothetical protein
MFSNSLKVIKIDQNMSVLWQTVCKNIILTLVHLFILLREMKEVRFAIQVTSRKAHFIIFHVLVSSVHFYALGLPFI